MFIVNNMSVIRTVAILNYSIKINWKTKEQSNEIINY